MIRAAIIALLLLAGCASHGPKFSSVPDDAPEWDLNVGRWPGTNDLAKVPGLR
jgi:hypothetical protein